MIYYIIRGTVSENGRQIEYLVGRRMRMRRRRMWRRRRWRRRKSGARGPSEKRDRYKKLTPRARP